MNNSKHIKEGSVSKGGRHIDKPPQRPNSTPVGQDNNNTRGNVLYNNNQRCLYYTGDTNTWFTAKENGIEYLYLCISTNQYLRFIDDKIELFVPQKDFKVDDYKEIQVKIIAK